MAEPIGLPTSGPTVIDPVTIAIGYGTCIGCGQRISPDDHIHAIHDASDPWAEIEYAHEGCEPR